MKAYVVTRDGRSASSRKTMSLLLKLGLEAEAVVVPEDDRELAALVGVRIDVPEVRRSKSILSAALSQKRAWSRIVADNELGEQDWCLVVRDG